MIAGTALLGAGAGFLWSAVAPRALIEVLGPGSVLPVNPETSAFIAADGWFALLTVIGGIISGLLGYALAVRRQGAPAMAGVLVAGLAAALLAKWIGQQSGAARVSAPPHGRPSPAPRCGSRSSWAGVGRWRSGRWPPASPLAASSCSSCSGNAASSGPWTTRRH